MAQPKLSVILPNYNLAQYLAGCLNSLLQQSVQPLEIIVIDDASTDTSIAIIEEFAAKHPVIRVVKNERNRGVVHNMNEGWKQALGEYIYYAAADDLVLPGLFEKSLQLLAQHKEAGLCCSDPASFIDLPDSGRKINENRLGLSAVPTCFTPDQVVDLARRKRVLFSGMSVMKRDAVQKADGFLEELKWHCDFFLIFLVVFRHGICYIPERLNLWRSTPGSYLAPGFGDWQAQRPVGGGDLELFSHPGIPEGPGRFSRNGGFGLYPPV